MRNFNKKKIACSLTNNKNVIQFKAIRGRGLGVFLHVWLIRDEPNASYVIKIYFLILKIFS